MGSEVTSSLSNSVSYILPHPHKIIAVFTSLSCSAIEDLMKT